MKSQDLKVCDSCPWLVKNHGKRKPVGWYSKGNLRRLWNGVRSGDAPGMVCHSTDPNRAEYGGTGKAVLPGREAECGGLMILLIKNVDAINKDGLKAVQPIKPGFTKRGVAALFQRFIFEGWLPSVERREDVGVPWR